LAEAKWYLITTIDDHSRKLLYAELWEKESSWAHIMAQKAVCSGFGCALKYYVDNHSIFRYVEHRDSIWRKHSVNPDDAFVQWKEVLKDLGTEVIYALSPAAKGKIERPYRWLQDHLVRICVRDNIDKIDEARQVLYWEVNQYNSKRVHSTTKEIPDIRFERALAEKRTLFQPFKIRRPYETPDDIFCYRTHRQVDNYRRVSLNNLKLGAGGAPIGSDVELRISFDLKAQTALIRIWHERKLIGEQTVKQDDLRGVQF
jgi:hypothetical protein